MNQILNFSKYKIDQAGNVYNKHGLCLKHAVDADGYHCVTMVSDLGKKTRKFVHRLVLETYNPTTDMTLVADHINRIRNDNRIENLRWATRKENRNNAYIKCPCCGVDIKI